LLLCWKICCKGILGWRNCFFVERTAAMQCLLLIEILL
jgi:hypothetical protein